MMVRFTRQTGTRPGSKLISGVVAFALLMILTQGVSATTVVLPSPVPVVSETPETSEAPEASTPSPEVSATPQPLIASEVRTLAREFVRAQASEVNALKHRQKMETKELAASQAAREKDWNRKEKLERDIYFENHQGADRRAYVKDFIARREALFKIHKDEKTRRLNDQAVHLESLKEDQAVKLREFREYLSRDERPPARLWPENR